MGYKVIPEIFELFLIKIGFKKFINQYAFFTNSDELKYKLKNRVYLKYERQNI